MYLLILYRLQITMVELRGIYDIGKSYFNLFFLVGGGVDKCFNPPLHKHDHITPLTFVCIYLSTY